MDDREEGQIQIKRQHKDDHTTPPARSVSVEDKYSPQPCSVLIESPEGSDTLSDTDIVPNCPAIINDVVGLELGPLPRKESRWFVDDTDVSEKWHRLRKNRWNWRIEKAFLWKATHSRYCMLLIVSFARLLRKLIAIILTV